MFLVDTHCHFNLLELATEDTIAAVIERARAAHVGHFLNVCVSIADFKELLQTALPYDFMDVSVGLHPNSQSESVDVATLCELGAHPKVIAIGETGLDYYRSTGNLSWQRNRFSAHIEAAKVLKKPIIVHTRMAKDDTLAILRAEGAGEVGGIMHCFSEDWPTAKACLDLGMYISFSGIVTFKNATDLQSVAAKVPLDRLLLETDAPYLAPNPKRGRQNEPAYVAHTAAFLAELRQIPVEELAAQTTANFFKLFQKERLDV